MEKYLLRFVVIHRPAGEIQMALFGEQTEVCLIGRPQSDAFLEIGKGRPGRYQAIALAMQTQKRNTKRLLYHPDRIGKGPELRIATVGQAIPHPVPGHGLGMERGAQGKDAPDPFLAPARLLLEVHIGGKKAGQMSAG